MDKYDDKTGIRLQTFKRGDYSPIKSGDAMITVLETAADSIDAERKAGMPAKYPVTEQGLDAFRKRAQEYFQAIIEHNNAILEGEPAWLPDVSGLAVFMGISRVTLLSYEKRGGDWREIVQLLKTAITAARFQAASEGKIPQVLEIFRAKCDADFVERNELKITTTQEKTDLDAESAIDAAGLRWDDEKQDYVPC